MVDDGTATVHAGGSDDTLSVDQNGGVVTVDPYAAIQGE
jgi:hypothetical protein